MWSNHYQNVGGDDGNQDQPSRVPTGGGADDDRTENADPTDRKIEAGDMAIVMALGLINEVNHIMLFQAITRSSSWQGSPGSLPDGCWITLICAY